MRAHRLVVGVDGSAAAAAALEWAVRRAAHDGDRLLVVTAWHPPRGAPGPELVAQRQAIIRMQRAQIARALIASGARPQVGTEIILADPVTALCHAGRAADLVVLGATGQPAPTSLVARVARRIAARRPELARAVVAVPEPRPEPPARPLPAFGERHLDLPTGSARTRAVAPDPAVVPASAG